MTDQQNQQQVLSQAVEREVRQILGDLHMQVIVLRQMLEMAQQPRPSPVPNPQQPTQTPPQPAPDPNQLPPQPPPENPPPQPHAAGNGRIPRGV